MVDRIRQIMEFKGLTSSLFADEIEVPRAILSHVLSGRNKPSLEVITKVLARYRELNPEWLLLGEGNMLKRIAGSEEENRIPVIEPPVAEKTAAIHQVSAADAGKVQNDDAASGAGLQQVDADKQVKQIVFFYTDHTFTIYKPEV